jgi:hypothetical protein
MAAVLPIAGPAPAGEAMPEDDPNEAAERQLRLDAFAQGILAKRAEAVRWRSSSGVERRWMEDLDAYHGRDEWNRPTGLMDSVASGVSSGFEANTAAKTNLQQTARSTVYVQLTRQKTNTATARVQEMLFPSDDKNWGISPTPVPELLEAIESGQNVGWVEGQKMLPNPDSPTDEPLTAADVASEAMRTALKKCEAMEKAIHDALEECSYVGHGRAAIADSAQLGAGILKGPVVVNRVSKKWAKHRDGTGTAMVMQFKQDTRPATFRVSPWDFFPDPSCGESIQDGSYCWEREHASGRKLRELARSDAYNRAAIIECLKEGPQRVTSSGNSYYEQSRTGDGYGSTSVTAFTDSRFELWTFVGEVSRDDIDLLGLQVPEEQRELYALSAIIVFCNDRPIKVTLNPMDGGDLPYDVFVWERVALSPFGVGIPYLMRYAQRTVNAAWRALLDNMGASAGVQLIMSEDVYPADGNYQIVGRKIWRMPRGGDVDKAFRVFEIPSRQVDLTNVIRLAMEFADAETALPQIAQGEQGSAPDTVGGMTLLMNAANTVLKRLARQFDDMVTKPHIRRYYDWMMQYHPDDAIKGDMQVAARGSSALVQRDQRNQNLTEVMAAATHPKFGVFLDEKRLFRVYLESKSVVPDSVMRSDAEIAQILKNQASQEPPKSPQEKVAEIRANADLQKIKVDTESEATNERLRQENAQRDRDHDMTMQLLAYRTKVLDYAEQRGITLEQFKQELQMLVLDKSLEREERAIDRAEARTMKQGDREHEIVKGAQRASQSQPAGPPA